MMYTYRAKIVNIVDGDTFDAVVDLGFSIYQKDRFRLYGIDTPETYRPSCKAELEHGKAAKQLVEELILGKEVIIRTEKDKKGKYGRYLADVLLDFSEENGARTLTDALKEGGFEKKESYDE